MHNHTILIDDSAHYTFTDDNMKVLQGLIDMVAESQCHQSGVIIADECIRDLKERVVELGGDLNEPHGPENLIHSPL